MVRVVDQHPIDERRSEWLDERVQLDRRAFVFCGLHAHMRLTEALVKEMFGRAIDTGKVAQLRSAFKTHLGMEDKFVRSDKKRGWKKVSFYGYECWRFAEQSDHHGMSKIERIIREVWGSGNRILTDADMLEGLDAKTASNEAHERFLENYCALWRSFNIVMRMTRQKNHSTELEQYGALCRDLGARWCLLLPLNRCNTFYLHTLMMHGGDFMQFCLERGLTVGMLENSGAERRHEVGRVQFRKSLSGGGKAYRGMKPSENRSAYLTLRGLLIWQYGRDLIAAMVAQAEFERHRSGPLKADRSRTGDGWKYAEEHSETTRDWHFIRHRHHARRYQYERTRRRTQYEHDTECGCSRIARACNGGRCPIRLSRRRKCSGPASRGGGFRLRV